MTHTEKTSEEARAEAGVAVPGAKNTRGSRKLETNLEREWSCQHLHFELLVWGTENNQAAQSVVLCMIALGDDCLTMPKARGLHLTSSRMS